MRGEKQGDEQCVPNVHELEFRDSAANPVVPASKSVVTGYCGLFQVIRAFWCGCMNTSSFPSAHLRRAYMSEQTAFVRWHHDDARWADGVGVSLVQPPERHHASQVKSVPRNS